MKIWKTRSKNLEIYPYLLAYSDPGNIPKKALSKKLGIHVNTINALIGQLKNNPKIVISLLENGYEGSDLPDWINKPRNLKKIEQEIRRGEIILDPVQPKRKSQGEPNKNVNKKTKKLDVIPTSSIITAIRNYESNRTLRDQAISPPAYYYCDPFESALSNIIRQNMVDNWNDKINQRKKPKKREWTLDEIMSYAKVYMNIHGMIQNNNVMHFLQTYNYISCLQNLELKSTNGVIIKNVEAFLQSIQKVVKYLTQKNEEPNLIKMMQIIVDKLKPSENRHEPYALIQEAKKQKKIYRESLIKLAEIFGNQSQRNKNPLLKTMENNAQESMENFYRTVGASPYPLTLYSKEKKYGIPENIGHHKSKKP